MKNELKFSQIDSTALDLLVYGCGILSRNDSYYLTSAKRILSIKSRLEDGLSTHDMKIINGVWRDTFQVLKEDLTPLYVSDKLTKNWVLVERELTS